MKTRKALFVSITIACIVSMSGCASTLFFPAKSAEKAADKIIDDIWPESVKTTVAAPEAKKS